MTRCYYYGCWNRTGHYLFAPSGYSPPSPEREAIELYAQRGPDDRFHLDGTLAPRKHGRTGEIACGWLMPERDARGAMNHSGECPQGQYLCHVLPSGFTAVQWWDRNQGDTRGGCNSTILLEGTHTAAEVLAAGRQHFPHVFENLRRASIELVEVKLG